MKMRSLIRSRNLYKKLQKRYSRKINLQRKRVNLALKKLNNLHLNIKNPINIIGSDGKYSTLKTLQSLIEENNEKVSTFTSPHLYNLRHRFWLKDKFIKINELEKNIKIIKKLKIKLTLFELLNIVYYIAASKLKKTSYALVESGLLFKGDSTRVWDKPRCQIVTNINKQHLEWVKPKTLTEVCKQKVGYLSKKTTIYIGKQNIQTMRIIRKILKKNPSNKIFYGQDWTLKKIGNNRIYKDQKGKIVLKGRKILSEGIWDNIGLAVKVARDFEIPKKKIIKGISKVELEGRFQHISKGKLRKILYTKEKLLLDGCHSIASAKNLANYLKTLDQDIYGIWGMQDHKEPELFIKQFRGIFKKIIAINIENEMKVFNKEKLKYIANKNNINCMTASSFQDAIKKITNKKRKTIVAFGSLYLVGQILNLN